MSAPVFSIHGLIAWLETQPPKTEYDFTQAHNCLATMYFNQFGIKRKGSLSYGPIVFGENKVWTRIIQGRPWTYGAALARARELVES